ncbi:intermembrane transport protein PqiB [Frigidibacter mobilis]|uniref:Paraquat-inducible protein B, putative n=1 Tax=Frigidibacter mobilis TaxID=1335048 RepID=A0A159Z2U3_9RHOB|nr:MlaD family protein [Frigidibacter mobilis]AMY69325.1 paraquat-inducible protein B, putative [Frigidibacter mobilis]
MTDPELPQMEVRPARKRWWHQLSPVWLVPLVALTVALGVAWQSYAGRGELITISFQNASGIEAGQTPLKFRDVTIGVVEQVNFGEGLSEVLVNVRVSRDVAPYIDRDAEFWVVRPEVSVRGVTGLDTVLSGAFIAGRWDSESTGAHTRFTGLEVPPMLGGPDANGMVVVLKLRDGNQISAGAPILYRGIEVGAVGAPRLSEDGEHVLINAFIQAPYTERLTSASRFWDASGFDVSISASGVELDVKSLASLIEGGISFDTVVSGGDPVDPGASFEVYPDERSARDSVFTSANDAMLPVSVVFDGSVSGLTVGAEVRFRGLKVGQVTDLGAFVEGTGAARRVRLRANLELQIGKLGLGEDATEQQALDLLATFVETSGLRARLATASILTGGLLVDLVELPDAAPATIRLDAEPYPELPTSEAALSDFAATSQGVFERINALPVEELMQSAIDALDSFRALAADPDTRRVPGAAAGLLEDTRALVTSDDVAAIPAELRAVAASARAILDRIEEGQAVENLIAAIGRADRALANLETASADFPAITAEVRSIAEKVDGLAMEELVASADRLLTSADALIGTEEARALPAAFTGALEEMTVFLAQIRAGGAIERANSAISAAEAAANSINEAAQSLPSLSERMSGLVVSADGVIASYGERSRFNTELMSVLRDIRSAADAVTALARTIERNPNSLILGR